MSEDSSGYYLIDPDFNVLSMNETAKQTYPGLEKGKKCYKCLMNLDEPCGPCPVVKGIKGPRNYVDPIRHITESVDAVDVPVEGIGLCHALLFSTVGKEAAFSAILPTTAQELKNLALVMALTTDYYDVFSVDLTNEMVTTYRHNGKNVDAFSIYGRERRYRDTMDSYIARFVDPADAERVRKESGIPNIRERLSQSESFHIHFKTIINGETHYYCHKIARVGDAESFEHVVFGVACEDEEMLKLKKTRELQRQIGEIETDSLTGLYTKEAFMVQGGKLLSDRADTAYDLCIFKLENLNLIIHQYGSRQADKLLQLIGSLLKEYSTKTNCIAYMGDGYFVSLTETTSRNKRQQDISEFRGNIIERSEIKSLSLKWSLYTEIERTLPITTVYESTMYALSTIRTNQHEEYVEFDKSMLTRMEFETAIENSFEEALAGGEFIAVYQPKYGIRSRRITGAEALVRWVKPDGTLVEPRVFIPVLERTGKINRLDEEVFRQVCEFQRELEKRGINDLHISVNLSRASMFTKDISKKYREIADSYGVSPSLIPIEITESAAVRAADIHGFANDLIRRGFVLHMDDFGAGYSSFASLNVIPFSSIKLDKSLIDYIGSEINDNLLKHIISFAHESGQTVIAEGVENQEQYLFLKVIGCDDIQGYYFSKPVGRDVFTDMLEQKT